MQKVIVVKSQNLTPEEEVNQRLAELGEGWRIVFSPITTMVTHGTYKDIQYIGAALHIYYTTTLVVEKIGG